MPAARATKIVGLSLIAAFVLIFAGKKVVESYAHHSYIFSPEQTQPEPANNEPEFPQIPADLLAAVQHPEQFQLKHKVSGIPQSVRAAFARAAHLNEFSMAEPGVWPWNATDARRPGLPDRRLLSVALSDTFCLIFYERGGIALTLNIAVFRVRPSVEALGNLNGYPDIMSLDALRHTLTAKSTFDKFY